MEINPLRVGAPMILPVPGPAKAPAVVLAGSGTAPIPSFLVQKPAGSGFWESLRVAFTRNVPIGRAAAVPFRGTFLKESGPSGNSFGFSLVLHWSLIVALVYLPQYLPVKGPGPIAYAAEPQPEVLYYAVPVFHTDARVPTIAPPGDAGRPGDGGAEPACHARIRASISGKK